MVAHQGRCVKECRESIAPVTVESTGPRCCTNLKVECLRSSRQTAAPSLSSSFLTSTGAGQQTEQCRIEQSVFVSNIYLSSISEDLNGTILQLQAVICWRCPCICCS